MENRRESEAERQETEGIAEGRMCYVCVREDVNYKAMKRVSLNVMRKIIMKALKNAS